ncbi:outer membrane channel protein TolC, partial [Pseudidiomarina aestuarii]
MKKHVLSVLIGLSFAASSVPAYADDLAQVFQLALQNDPTLQRVDAERRAAQK